MASGPSKQELEMYFKSSRQYFDELARHYQQADPQYYKEYILPFYSNPFHSASGTQRSGGGGAKLMVVIALFGVLAAGAAAFFVFMNASSTDEPNVKEKRVQQQDVKEKTREVPKSTDKDLKDVFPSDDFLLGSKYLAQKDYDKAEEYLKRVKPDDPNYEQAQQMLESIKVLRKYDPK
jgi:tetratricopeptide (TPR) repeat protein